MITYPNSKINLGLNIVEKRSDGFHDIESVFFPIPWCDILEIVSEESGFGKAGFTSSGIDIPSNGKPNLCEQVYQLMSNKYELPSVRMHLHKIVPIGAGLGGGSADATYAAIMLNEMFQLGLYNEQLEAVVAEVGSDCPFFVQNRPAYVTGRGETLQPFNINLSGFWMVLVNPNIHIGTKEAYAGLVPSQPKTSLKENLQMDISAWNTEVQNDFESSIFPVHPEIENLKEQLYRYGAQYASMTGSGSTVYGIFEFKPKPLLFNPAYSIKTLQL